MTHDAVLQIGQHCSPHQRSLYTSLHRAYTPLHSKSTTHARDGEAHLRQRKSALRQGPLVLLRRRQRWRPRGLSKAKERRQGLSEFRRCDHEGCRRPNSDGKACRSSDEQRWSLLEVRRVTEKPIILKLRPNLIPRGHHKVCRRPKSDDEAYVRT